MSTFTFPKKPSVRIEIDSSSIKMFVDKHCEAYSWPHIVGAGLVEPNSFLENTLGGQLIFLAIQDDFNQPKRAKYLAIPSELKQKQAYLEAFKQYFRGEWIPGESSSDQLTDRFEIPRQKGSFLLVAIFLLALILFILFLFLF